MNRELQTLGNALAWIEPLVAPGTPVPRLNTDDHDLAVVATALLRKGYVQALAISAIAQTDTPEGGIPNLRSMLEALGELHFLIESTDPHEQARIAFIYSLRELRDFYKTQDDPEELARVEAELAQKSKDVPFAFAEAMKRNSYWIPKGRAQIVDEAIGAVIKQGGQEPEQTGRDLYKLLSWDGHHVMAAMLSIQLNPKLPRHGCVKQQDAPEDPHIFLPFMATGTLAAMLGLYFGAFPETKPKDGAS